MISKYYLRRDDLVDPDLSFKIVGVLFEVYNQLGGGYREKYYQKAISLELRNVGLLFKEQVTIPLIYKSQSIGNNYLDFLIENKIVLEIKSGEYFNRRYIEQIYSYLKETKIKLGILAVFTKTALRYKRILNVR